MTTSHKNRIRRLATIASFTALSLLAPREVNAASLQAVSGWDTRVLGYPADVTMYAYVPDQVAANPPILTLIHRCAENASEVLGKASVGGIVAAADRYGFIIIVPSNPTRCWDVVTDQAWQRDANGDTHAISLMVRFAVTKYSANPNRVYVTGDSEGGMLTELLLAVYPDVFKAGSAFGGMPAGCRDASESAQLNGSSKACARGDVTHTGAEWGAIVSKMAPSYSGNRPRMQLFHGDADTVVQYENFTEAIKEWTNVLGLNAAPSSTESGISLGTHQAKRQEWQNGCGFALLDAFTSLGGDHGLSDTLFNSQYVIPFLGLDVAGDLDPETSACSGSTGGASGSAGTVSASGTTGSGGNSGEGGASSSAGAAASSGGTTLGAASDGGGSEVAEGGRQSGSGGAAAASGAVPGARSGAGSESNACSCSVVRGSVAPNLWFAVLVAAALRIRSRRQIVKRGIHASILVGSG